MSKRIYSPDMLCGFPVVEIFHRHGIAIKI